MLIGVIDECLTAVSQRHHVPRYRRRLKDALAFAAA
jgi:hypothetical protein